jgi:hypothetical protein
MKNKLFLPALVIVVLIGVISSVPLKAETKDNLAPKLTYTGGFKESNTNDGSVIGSIKMKLTGDVFSSMLYIPNQVVVSNIPVGLTPVLTKTSTTTAFITLTGNATFHANPADISNLAITFIDGAFKNHYASDILNYIYDDGIVNFHN